MGIALKGGAAMGMFKPEPSEKHRLVLELPGGGQLTQEKYKAYKREVKKVAERYGAKITKAEFVVVRRKPPK